MTDTNVNRSDAVLTPRKTPLFRNRANMWFDDELQAALDAAVAVYLEPQAVIARRWLRSGALQAGFYPQKGVHNGK
jgi:hypothetical protein